MYRTFKTHGYALLEHAPGADDIRRYGAYMLMNRQHPGYYEREGQDACESRYGDVLSEALLRSLRPHVETAVEASLLPCYSSMQVFAHGAEIAAPTASPAEEISVIMALGAKGVDDWPMRVQAVDSAERQASALAFAPGAAWVLDTGRVRYRREAYAGEFWLQLNLHYVRAEGAYTHYRFDGRRGLGEPLNRGQQNRNIELRKVYDSALAAGDDRDCFCDNGKAYSACHGQFDQTLTA